MNRYNKLYQGLYNNCPLSSKTFFLAPVCISLDDSKVCEAASPARLALGGMLLQPAVWMHANRHVLFSKASTHLLARAARPLLSTGALPC